VKQLVMHVAAVVWFVEVFSFKSTTFICVICTLYLFVSLMFSFVK